MNNSVMNTSTAVKLSELMKNINVYVEVRTGEDNRSEGIKKVISSLGAKVNNRLTKSTTHVVFKDGLLSTYKKAKQLNIPLVSILWIESCKKNCKIMDPALYPISNIDRYEFPEMYDKVKRIKNMQPDAVDTKTRVQNVKQIMKNNGKTFDSPKISKIKVPRIPKTPKDNLNNILSDFQDKIMSTPDLNESFVFKSKLLERIQNSPFTPKTNNKDITMSRDKINESSISEQESDKSDNVSVRESTRNKKPNLRYTNKNFVTQSEKIRKKSSRKTIASTPIEHKIDGTKNLESYFTPIREKKSNTQFISEKNSIVDLTDKDVKDQNSNFISEMSQQSSVECLKENVENVENLEHEDLTPNGRPEIAINRRTLYTPQNMEMSSPFHSLRKPTNNRRRTLFDISLDIIDKGLKNINEQIKMNKTKVEESTIKDISDTSRVEELQKPPSAALMDSENTPVVKKRKLFMPDQFELTPVAEYNKTLLSSTKRIRDSEVESVFAVKNCDKKRRTTINVLAPTFNKENRRSSFDFDKISKVQLDTPPQTVNSKQRNIIVCTNMHKEQLDFVERVVKTLGNYEIQTNVTAKTTHVVSLESRRTINIIKGIIRGLWILKYEWIVDCFNAGKWLNEERYELREFSRSVEICRSERQAFGPSYKMEILSGLAPIYISHKCKIPIDSLKDIIKLCAGEIVDDPKQCKYVIGDYVDEKICLQPQWILDSITNNKILKFYKYVIKPQN